MAERIEKQMRDQRELLAAVSHELRTPLARIRILTELARGRGADPKTMDEVDREVVEMDQLVGELLASSRLDFSALTYSRLDARDAAAKALERAGLSPSLLRMDAAEVWLEADATLLARALANLLDNAQRHGRGVRALRVRQDHGRARFTVNDAGPGFSDEELPKVFQAFYRGSASAKEGTERPGLGLGLALVQRIAQAHGGRAFAENLPGGGACVGLEVALTRENRVEM
jgi:signal transduction histidine kinase